MLHHHGASLRRLDDRRVEVAGDVALAPARIGLVVLERLLAVEREAALRRADGDEVVEAVAGVDVEVPAHGAEPVRRIEVGVGARVPRAAPEPFVLRLEEDLPQVVQVGRLGVQHLAEQSRVHHAVHQHLVVAVVAVLELDAVLPRALARVDEGPEVLERRADGTFARGVLAVRQRGEHHRHVPFPRRRGVDEIDVVARDEPLEGVIGAGVERRVLLPRVGGHLRGALGLVGYQVVQRHDLHVRHAEQIARAASVRAGRCRRCRCARRRAARTARRASTCAPPARGARDRGA